MGHRDRSTTVAQRGLAPLDAGSNPVGSTRMSVYSRGRTLCVRRPLQGGKRSEILSACSGSLWLRPTVTERWEVPWWWLKSKRFGPPRPPKTTTTSGSKSTLGVAGPTSREGHWRRKSSALSPQRKTCPACAWGAPCAFARVVASGQVFRRFTPAQLPSNATLRLGSFSYI